VTWRLRALWSAPEDFESNRALRSLRSWRATAILATVVPLEGVGSTVTSPHTGSGIDKPRLRQITCNPIGGLTMRSYSEPSCRRPVEEAVAGLRTALQRARTHDYHQQHSLNQLRPALIFNGGRRTLFGQPVQYVVPPCKKRTPLASGFFVDPKQQADKCANGTLRLTSASPRNDFGPIWRPGETALPQRTPRTCAGCLLGNGR